MARKKKKYRNPYRRGGSRRVHTQRSSSKAFGPRGSEVSPRKLVKGAIAIGFGVWALGTVLNKYKEVK